MFYCIKQILFNQKPIYIRLLVPCRFQEFWLLRARSPRALDLLGSPVEFSLVNNNVLNDHEVYYERVIADASAEKISFVAGHGQGWKIASSEGFSDADLHMM